MSKRHALHCIRRKWRRNIDPGLRLYVVLGYNPDWRLITDEEIIALLCQ